MTDPEASAKAKEQRSRRREFDPKTAIERLDKRHVKTAQFKMLRIHVTITDELLRAADARAATMNFGRGMSRSEFIGYVLGMFLTKGRAAREFQQQWKETQEARNAGIAKSDG